MGTADPGHPGHGLDAPDEHVHISTEVTKDECWKYLGSLAPMPVVLGIVAYSDALLRPGAIALAACALGCIASTALPLLRGEGAVRDTWVGVCTVNMVLRTIAHLVLAAWHNDSLVFRVFTIVLIPLSTSRQSHSMRLFRAYCGVHIAIVLWRFSGNLEVEWPWLLCTIVGADFQRLIVEDRIAQRCLLQKLAAQKRQAIEVAERMMTNMLQTYCDATMIMAPDMSILEDPPELEVLMNRKNMKGRNFAEFIEPSDLDAFHKHMEGLLAELRRGIPHGSPSDSGGDGGPQHAWYLHSCQLRLIDSYAVLFEVTLSSVCMRNSRGQPVVLMGVSEMSSKKEKKRSQHGQRKPIYRINFETGNLESMVSSFSESDVEVVKSAKTLALELREHGKFKNPFEFGTMWPGAQHRKVLDR